MKIIKYAEFEWNFNPTKNVDIDYTSKLSYKDLNIVHVKTT